MAILQFTGFETGELLTSGSSKGENTTGFQGTQDTNISVQTSTKRTGSYALRTFPTTTNWEACSFGAIGADGIIDETTGFNIATTYIQFYFQYATKPASASEEILRFQDTSAGLLKLAVRIDSNGKLSIYDSTNTIIGSVGSTVLSSGTWYQIRVKCGTGLTAAVQVQINGVDEFNTTANTLAANVRTILMGKSSNQNGNTVDFFYDDVVIDDSTFPSGAASVLALKPTANGITMNWGTGTGSSDYQELQTIPEDGTTYVKTTTGAGTPIIGMFAMQDCATVGITGTINAVKLVIATRENTANVSAHFARIKSSAATTDNASTFNGSTIVTMQTVMALTDPNTGSAWTTSGIDAVEMGPVENNNVSVRCDQVLGMVLFTSSTPNATNSRFLMFMPT